MISDKYGLFINDYIPYPATSGGSIIISKIIYLLSKNFKLDGFFLGKSKFKEEFLKKNAQFIKIETVFYPRKDFNFKFKENLLATFNKLPVICYTAYLKEMDKKINAAINNSHFDFIFLNRITTAQYLKDNFKGLKILNLQDTEDKIWEKRYKIEKNIWNKIIYYLEYKKLYHYQKIICKKFDIILLLSEEDKEHLKICGISSSKIFVYSPFADSDLLELPQIEFNKVPNNLLFIGTLNWFPNSEGIYYFLKNIFPIIKKQIPDLKIYIVGYGAEDKLKKFQSPDIIFTGFAENLEEYYKNCKLFVAPIYIGSGIRIKILNALARGIPVITTQLGAEGIKAENGKHLVITKNDDELIKNIIKLLADDKLLNKLSRQGRELITNKYLENNFKIDLEKIIADIGK